MLIQYPDGTTARIDVANIVYNRRVCQNTLKYALDDAMKKEQRRIKKSLGKRIR